MLFRMVPKLVTNSGSVSRSFRAVLFRMVPKHDQWNSLTPVGFRAVLFRMVPKLVSSVPN